MRRLSRLRRPSQPLVAREPARPLAHRPSRLLPQGSGWQRRERRVALVAGPPVTNPRPALVDKPPVPHQQPQQDAPAITHIERQRRQLAADRQALQEARDQREETIEDDKETADLEAQLRRQIRELVNKLAADQEETKQADDEAKTPEPPPEDPTAELPDAAVQEPAPLPAPAQTGPPNPSKSPGKGGLRGVGEEPVDAAALAEVLFRAGNYAGALQAYQMIDADGQWPDDRLGVQYMTATCLRKLGRLQEAETTFREVANAKSMSPFVDFARWQLNAMQWRKQIQVELEDLRLRREAAKVSP